MATSRPWLHQCGWELVSCSFFFFFFFFFDAASPSSAPCNGSCFTSAACTMQYFSLGILMRTASHL